MKIVKTIIVCSAAAMLLGAGQAAFAHASILNAITSGAAGLSRVGVNHADNHTVPPTPIVAQAVVFPTVNPILGRSDAVPVISLGDYFSTTAAGAAGTIPAPPAPQIPAYSPLNTLANLPQLIQSRDIFTQQIEQRNASNQVIGWVSTKGLLQVNLHGEVPFRFGAVHFRSAVPIAANNPNNITVNDLCVKALAISVPVADIANIAVKPPFTTVGAPGTATANVGYNLWVDNTLANFNDSGFSAAEVENGAASTTLTINRDTAINPYPANTCEGFGGTTPLITITVKPSVEDIRALQFPGWGTTAPGNTFQ